MKYYSKVSKWIHRLHVTRFISYPSQLAITWIRSPRIEEEFILSLGFELIKIKVSRKPLRFIDIYKILSEIRSKQEESAHTLYQISRIPQAILSPAKARQFTTARMIYTIYPKVDNAPPYKYANILGRALIPTVPSEISPAAPQKFYKTRALQTAISTFKSFDVRKLGAVSRVHEKMFEAIAENKQPVIEERASLKDVIQFSPSKLIIPHVLTRKVKNALSIYESYVRRMIYNQKLLFEPVCPTSFIDTLDLFAQKTLWSETWHISHPRFSIRIDQKTQPHEKRILLKILGRSLPSQLPLKIGKPSKAEEMGKASIAPARTDIFLERFTYPLAYQPISLKTEYFSLVAELFGKMIETSRTIPLMMPRIISLVGETFKHGAIELKIIKHYAEAISGNLPYLMRYQSVIERFTPNNQFITHGVIKLVEHFGSMEKSLNIIYHSILGAKVIFSGIPPHPVISEPLFEVSHGGWSFPIQLLRINEAASALRMFSPTSFPSSEASRVRHPINITVRIESKADEDDLKELERKIVKILREEARRHGLDI